MRPQRNRKNAPFRSQAPGIHDQNTDTGESRSLLQEDKRHFEEMRVWVCQRRGNCGKGSRQVEEDPCVLMNPTNIWFVYELILIIMHIDGGFSKVYNEQGVDKFYT